MVRLSTRMTTAARILLTSIAVWCIATGIAYDPILGDVPSTMGPLVAVIPPRLWAYSWIAAGVLMIAGLRWYRCRQWGTALAMGLTLLLAFIYVSAWITGDMERGWVSAKNYLLICVVVMTGAAIMAEGVLARGSHPTTR